MNVARLFHFGTPSAASALLGILLTLSSGSARADTLAAAPLPTDPLLTDPLLVDDPLHGFCWGNSSCSDNGTLTPVDRNPQFGFSISPGPNTGYFYVDFLVPINEASAPSTLRYVINGTQGGTANDKNINATATLVSNTTPWTSGNLVDYLNRGTTPGNTTPKNPISAFLPSTQTQDPGATGYYVYDAALGWNTLADVSKSATGPLLQLGSGGSPMLALGSLIVGFLNTGAYTHWVSTAQSGALFDIPEPASLLLFGAGLFVLAAVRWVRHARSQASRSRGTS